MDHKQTQGGGAASQQPPAVRRSEYWAKVFVLVFVAGFFISIAAVCYGIIVTPPLEPGQQPRIAFPWIGWFAAMLVASAVILGLAQFIAGKQPVGEGDAHPEQEKAWASQLPDRALRVYTILKGAPIFMVCFALIALGATLLVIDGAFALVSGLFLALVPYAPYFIGGVTVFAVAIAALMAWFRHANNRLAAEYAFRREVLARTGVILLDEKGKALLPPSGDREGYSVALIGETDVSQSDIVEATPLAALPEAKQDPEA